MTATNQNDRAPVPPEVAALFAALHLSQPDAGPLTRLRDEEWATLLKFSDTAHLTLPLAQLSNSRFPAWVRRRLQTNLNDNALRFENAKVAYRAVAEALSEAGIDHVVIKGFTQAPDYVGHPRLRSQSDIDLYCPPAMIASARAALQAIGYRSSTGDTSNADHEAVLIPSRDRAWSGNHFDPGISLGIELHFCLWNERVSLFSIPGVEDFWDRRTTRTIDGFSFSCLSQVDHLGHLTLHILRNIFLHEWIVHHVYELAVFLHARSEDDAFWRLWSETHDPSLRSIEAIAFYLARSWFGCRLHYQAEEAIASIAPLQQDWLRTFSGSPLDGMFRQNKDFLWLHLSFLQSPKTKLVLTRRTLVPPRIAPIDSPTVKLKNKRLRQTSGSNRYWQYIVYLADRSASHSIASLSTLARGMRWNLSRHQLPRQFWTFLAVSFFFDLGLFIYFFLFNLFLIGHGYTEKTLGLLASVAAAGGFTGAIPASRFARRFGLRPVLIAMFFLAAAIFSARALLLAVPIQLALAFLAGMILSIWAVCLSPTVAQLTNEQQRPFAFSLVFSLGISIGALGGWLGSRLPGWINSHVHLSVDPLRLVLLFSCAILLTGLLPLSRLTFAKPTLATRARPAFLSPFLLRFLPAIALWELVTGSFSPFANVYFAQHQHMPLTQIGNAFSLAQLAQVVAVLLAPLLFRRRGLVSGIIFTQISSALLLCLLASTHTALGATMGYMAFTAFQWMNEPGLYSLLMDRVPEDQREGAAAANSLVTSASLALAAMLAGGAFARFGYPVPMLCIAGIAVISAGLFRGLVHTPQPKTVLKLDRLAE